MLLIFEKVLELVIKRRVEIFLENNDIITKHQSGFRKWYSYEIAIQTITDEWSVEVSR